MMITTLASAAVMIGCVSLGSDQSNGPMNIELWLRMCSIIQAH